MSRLHPKTSTVRRQSNQGRRRRSWLWLKILAATGLVFVPALDVSAQSSDSIRARTDSVATSAAHSHGHPKGIAHEHGPSVTATPLTADSDPVLLTGMGDHTMARVSGRGTAQAYFDQGLMLAYGFNHPEAAVSFAFAAKLDSECALCAWGEALVLGPNINAQMDASAVTPAHGASREALARLGPESSGLERDLVEALAERYVQQPPADRGELDLAYALAMAEVARRHPDDADVQALYADALMTTMPWDYWAADGSPRPATVGVIQALEASLAAEPRHPLANHLWIHLWEKNEPTKAVPAAERLEGLAPAAGHLVHMPAHVYIRVGRYADAVVANQRAIVADQAYLAQSGTDGLYRIGYVPHNVHFLWAAATLAGRSRTALDAADRLAAAVDPDLMQVAGYDIILQDYWIAPILARVRFGKWDEILDWPQIDEELLYPSAALHYARGVALVRTGRVDEAKREAARLERIVSDDAMREFRVWDVNAASDILAIAYRVVRAEIAAAEGRTSEAVSLLRSASTLEDGLLYQEPEAWHHPVRQVLGAVLLDAGRAAEAEQVFRDDLIKYPMNGWSLWGLATAMEAQGRLDDATSTWRLHREAFRDADVVLTSSRF